MWRLSRTWTSWRRSSSIAASRARSPSKREFRPEGDGLVADCRLTGQRHSPQPGRAAGRPRTSPDASGWRSSSREPAAAGPHPVRSAGRRFDAADIYRVYFHGPAYQVLKRAWWHERRQRSASSRPTCPTITTRRPAAGDGAAADRALLPDGGPLGDGRASIAWACRGTSIAYGCTACRRRRPVRCTRSSLPIRRRKASTPTWWMRAGTRYLHVSGYRTVTFRENVDARLFPAAEP